MDIFLVYLMFVTVITIIGSSRGRGVGGFFVSLLLSPFVGLIWVLAMPNLKEKSVQKTLEKQLELNTKVCPKCAETVKSAAKICKHCGNKFDEEEKYATC